MEMLVVGLFVSNIYRIKLNLNKKLIKGSADDFLVIKETDLYS